jgi:beta-xylosidase
MKSHPAILFAALALFGTVQAAFAETARNPIIHADVPDLSIIRVGNTYYMSSTTMHLSPGLPIMKSTDLVNWEIASYAYDTLADMDELNLNNGKSTYGMGTWASSLRHHNGTYYVSTFAQTTGLTYIFSTKDPDKGPWEKISFRPMMHDHSLFFDDDGRVYMLYGGGDIRLVELKEDLTGLKEGGFNDIVIREAHAVASRDIGLPAEGSQLVKHDGKYYLFNITWPRNGMRTVVIHRADKITGPWEGRVGLADKGIAQGCLIDTPSGEWFAYLFRDFGAVGRIPYLVPVKWKDGWPELGVDGKVPDTLDLPPSTGLIPNIIAADEFNRKPGDRPLPMVWQWNHNPANNLWTLTERPGFLRLKTNRIDAGFLEARNTLTQRTIGPECSATVSLDAAGLKDGDVAGIAMLQRDYGYLAVKQEDGRNHLVMLGVRSGSPVEIERVALDRDLVLLRVECDFRERADSARFHYSLDGRKWNAIGDPHKMSYTIPHFMGHRLAIFYYSTTTPGGHADFDFFRVSDRMDGGRR